MQDLAFQDQFERVDWASTPLGARSKWSSDLSKALQFVLDTAQPAFLLWGPDLTILFNPGFASIMGPRWPDALGTSTPTLWEPIWEQVAAFTKDAFAGHGGLAEDVPLATWASGFQEIRHYTFSYTPVRCLEGNILGATCICADTTERVRAAAATKRERDQLFRLYENTPGFIAMAEGPEHRFTYVNRAYARLVGSEELVGRTVAEAMPELVEQGFIELLDHARSTGQPIHANDVPIDFVSDDGMARRRFVSFVYEPMRDPPGRVTGIFCEGVDVTEEKLAREKVQALQSELIHVARRSAMGAMASTLAHELNQPLTAINTYASAALNLWKQGGRDWEAITQCLEGTASASAKADSIVKSVRRFSQPNAQLEVANLNELIREAVGLALLGPAGSGITIHYELTGPITIAVDGIQIQQVLINLVRNAVEAMQGCPRKELLICTERADGSARICIGDTGPGIDPAFLTRIFDAFVSGKADGLGLGLSISRTIVEAHGGSIHAFNKEEGGATFCVLLPTGPVAGTDEAPCSAPQENSDEHARQERG